MNPTPPEVMSTVSFYAGLASAITALACSVLLAQLALARKAARASRSGEQPTTIDNCKSLLRTTTALAICAFLYSNFLWRAETREAAFAYVLLAVYGLLFGFAVLSLLATVAQLAAAGRLTATGSSPTAYVLVVIIGPVFLLRCITTVAQAGWDAACAPTCPDAWDISSPLLAGTAGFAVLIAAGFAARLPIAAPLRKATSRRAGPTAVSWLVLVSVVAAALLSLYSIELYGDRVPPVYAPAAVVVLATVGLLAFVMMTAAALTGRGHPKPSGAARRAVRYAAAGPPG
jgi:hypothetical protein